jgi:hypothetical protein
MRMFDVQGVEIMAPCHQVFEFVREPGNLPRWAHAFLSAGDGRARLERPAARGVARRTSSRGCGALRKRRGLLSRNALARPAGRGSSLGNWKSTEAAILEHPQSISRVVLSTRSTPMRLHSASPWNSRA